MPVWTNRPEAESCERKCVQSSILFCCWRSLFLSLLSIRAYLLPYPHLSTLMTLTHGRPAATFVIISPWDTRRGRSLVTNLNTFIPDLSALSHDKMNRLKSAAPDSHLSMSVSGSEQVVFGIDFRNISYPNKLHCILYIYIYMHVYTNQNKLP